MHTILFPSLGFCGLERSGSWCISPSVLAISVGYMSHFVRRSALARIICLIKKKNTHKKNPEGSHVHRECVSVPVGSLELNAEPGCARRGDCLGSPCVYGSSKGIRSCSVSAWCFWLHCSIADVCIAVSMGRYQLLSSACPGGGFVNQGSTMVTLLWWLFLENENTAYLKSHFKQNKTDHPKQDASESCRYETWHCWWIPTFSHLWERANPFLGIYGLFGSWLFLDVLEMHAIAIEFTLWYW